jgi:hypothetical protein
MMLKSSLMLGSVYSRVNELVRNTPSKYKTINKRKESGIEGIGIGEGRRGKHKGRCT